MKILFKLSAICYLLFTFLQADSVEAQLANNEVVQGQHGTVKDYSTWY